MRIKEDEQNIYGFWLEFQYILTFFIKKIWSITKKPFLILYITSQLF